MLAQSQFPSPNPEADNTADGDVLDISNLADALKQTRKQRKLTLAEVSEETGLTISTISRIENRIFKPRADTFMILLQWMGITPDQVRQSSRNTEQGTMTRISLILKEDAKLSERAVQKLLQAWRPMYELYTDEDKA